MINFLSIVSFWGFVVCVALLIIRKLKRKPVKQVVTGLAICIVLFIICAVVSPSDEKSSEVEEQPQIKNHQTVSQETEISVAREAVKEPDKVESLTETKKDEKEIKYDKLQKIFIAIKLDTSEDDIKDLINKYGVKYSADDYNGTPKKVCYKIAFEEGVAVQKYADSGDYIEVSFSKEDGSLLVAEYFNNDAFKEAILYNYGVYWDFNENKPNNDYTGYYYKKPGDTEGGITIKYRNGNSKDTGYYSALSAKSALNNGCSITSF